MLPFKKRKEIHFAEHVDDRNQNGFENEPSPINSGNEGGGSGKKRIMEC